jgi:hypothetical protein
MKLFKLHEMRRTAVPAAVAIAFLFAVAAQAQNTDTLEVELGACSKTHRYVWIVRDGHDEAPTPLDGLVGPWTIHLDDPRDAGSVKASLRLGGFRTGCQKSHPVPDPKNVAWRFKAKLKFVCDEQPAQDVRLTISPHQNPAAYVRYLKKTVHDNEDCTETSPIAGIHTIVDWRFETEKLLLQLGLPTANVKGTGLSVNEIRTVMKGKNPIKLGRDDVVYVLEVQDARGRWSASNISGPAIDINTRKLKESKLDRIEVEVP